MRPYTSDGKEIEINAPWIQILSLPAGSPVVNLEGGGDIPLTGLFTLNAPKGDPWNKLIATAGVKMLIGEMQDTEPPQGAPFFPLDAATGQPSFLATLKGGDVFLSMLDSGGVDLNNAGGFAANTIRYSGWIDVSAYVALIGAFNFSGQGNPIGVMVEFSTDGSQAPGATPDGSANFGSTLSTPIPGAQPSVSRCYVVARFARLKLTAGATVGSWTLRGTWGGQLT